MGRAGRVGNPVGGRALPENPAGSLIRRLFAGHKPCDRCYRGLKVSRAAPIPDSAVKEQGQTDVDQPNVAPRTTRK